MLRPGFIGGAPTKDIEMMASGSNPRAWEARAQEWAWAGPGGSAFPDAPDLIDSDAEDDYDPDSATLLEAQETFYDLIVDWKIEGHLSATRACILAFWAAKHCELGRVWGRGVGWMGAVG